MFLLGQMISALWAVNTEESANVFVSGSVQLVRDMTLNVHEFYAGEYVGLLKDAVIRQGQDETAACEREIDDARREADLASDELQARLTAAKDAEDREAEHAVWREREILQAAGQARVDAASKRLDAAMLRIDAFKEVASQLSVNFS